MEERKKMLWWRTTLLTAVSLAILLGVWFIIAGHLETKIIWNIILISIFAFSLLFLIFKKTNNGLSSNLQMVFLFCTILGLIMGPIMTKIFPFQIAMIIAIFSMLNLGIFLRSVESVRVAFRGILAFCLAFGLGRGLYLGELSRGTSFVLLIMPALLVLMFIYCFSFVLMNYISALLPKARKK